MKASVQYNDFKGFAAADISDYLGVKHGDFIDSFGKFFKIDEDRFTVIGISIYGTEDFYISLYCIDKKRSSSEKEYIVSMSVPIEEDDEKEILSILFKRLHIVLHSRFDEKHSNSTLDYDEEVRYEDYHDVNQHGEEERF